MYVGHTHTATVRTTDVLEFECSHCDHRAMAVVLGVGQGGGQSPFFLDERGAKDRAASSAEAAARTNARLTLSLARCPSCQRRNERVLTSLKVKAMLSVVAIVVGAPLFGLFIDALKNTTFGVWIFVLLAPLMAWIAFVGQAVQWKNVDARVVFVESP